MPVLSRLSGFDRSLGGLALINRSISRPPVSGVTVDMLVSILPNRTTRSIDFQKSMAVSPCQSPITFYHSVPHLLWGYGRRQRFLVRFSRTPFRVRASSCSHWDLSHPPPPFWRDLFVESLPDLHPYECLVHAFTAITSAGVMSSLEHLAKIVKN